MLLTKGSPFDFLLQLLKVQGIFRLVALSPINFFPLHFQNPTDVTTYLKWDIINKESK